MISVRKVALYIGGTAVMFGILGFSTFTKRRNALPVQTTKAVRKDLSSVVSASGEVKPKTYVNIDANAFGKITKLYVKEGDKVKRGQVLAQLENVQATADLNAAQASLQASKSDAVAADAAVRTSEANLNRAKAVFEHSRLDWERNEALWKEGLIPKSDYDTQSAAWQTAQADLAQAEAGVAQAKAQKQSAQLHITENEASLGRASDVFQKTRYLAPFDGVVTNLPVREGETVVVGIQNSPGSTLMSIADLSVITAEVRVDETDIVDVKLGQAAEVTLDALPDEKILGAVSSIGNNAIVRSTGVATAQASVTNGEAKEFKVVITLQNAPGNLRPGLTATAKITTARKPNAIAVPIQALTIRRIADMQSKNGATENGTARPASTANAVETQGVFCVRNGKAEFEPVRTGISASTDTEILAGLEEGSEIVIGPYKALRDLRSGEIVKVDNSIPRLSSEDR